MTERFADILARQGRDILVLRGEETVRGKAFFQPLVNRKEAAPYGVTSLGAVDVRLWRCLTRTELRDGDRIECGGKRYAVQNSAAVYAGGELSHWWGVLTPEREEAAV